MEVTGTGVLHIVDGQSSEDVGVRTEQVVQSQKRSRILNICAGFGNCVLLKEHGFVQIVSCSDSIQSGLTELYLQYSIIDIAFGDNHAIALTGEGELIAFGANDSGQCGVGATSELISHPTPIATFQKLETHVIDIACGKNHSMALTESGEVYTWGTGVNGQLGTQTLSLQISPRYVAKLTESILAISCGDYVSAAISENGNLYMWGDAINGQCGCGKKTMESLPVHVDMDGTPIIKVSSGFNHTLCLTDSGALYGFGQSMYGQIGVELETKYIDSPVSIPHFSDNNIVIKDIHCCANYSIVISETNDVYMFGKNEVMKPSSTPETIQSVHCDYANSAIFSLGCWNKGLIAVTPTAISKCQPSIFGPNGRTQLTVSGNGFYPTDFTPTVKLQCGDETIELVGSYNSDEDTPTLLHVTTPNLSHLMGKSEYQEVLLSVALDGQFFTQPFKTHVTNALQPPFQLYPICGSTTGGVTCTVSSESIHSSHVIERLDISHLTIKLINQDTEQEAIIPASVKDHSVQFDSCALEKGNYSVVVALDGQDFFPTNSNYAVYNLESVAVVPEQINLSQCDAESIHTEIEINHFIYDSKHSDDIKIEVAAENTDSQPLTVNASYESQSMRDIKARRATLTAKFDEERTQVSQQKTEEETALQTTRTTEDEQKQKDDDAFAKKKKKLPKKPKPAQLEEIQKEEETRNSEWQTTVDKRKEEDQALEGKYTTLLEEIDTKEAAVPWEEEHDDGHGYLACDITLGALRELQLPSFLNIGVTSNNQIYQNVTQLQCVDPKIARVAPNCTPFAKDQTLPITVHLEGMTLSSNDDVKKVCIEDKGSDVDCTDITVNDDTVAFTLPKLSKSGEYKLTIELSDSTVLTTLYSIHDPLKISKITPKVIPINGCESLEIAAGNLIASDQCRVKLSLNEETTIECEGTIAEDLKTISCAVPTLESWGEQKTVQVVVTLNGGVDWIGSKNAVSVK